MSTVVVTGASRGIGRYLAERALGRGDRVVGLARTAVDTAFDCRPCDVTDPASVERSLEDLRKDGSVFALINAAGVASMNLFLTTPVETIQRIVATNLLGTMYCSQVLGRTLARNGQGRIVNFSSIAVALGIAGEAVYAASKAGVEAFTRVFAREMSPHGVMVNAIAPGPVGTAMIEGLDEERIRAVVESQVIRRRIELPDIWDAVEFLLSPKSAALSGEVLHLGGV